MVDNVYQEDTYRANCFISGIYSSILTACISQRASYGTNYIEIYETEVRNLSEVITHAHNLLVPPTPTPTPTPLPVQLANISTRTSVGTGENVLIGGFIITGNQPKKVILRAIGPSLPVSDALPDPVLEQRDPSGGIIAENDNWQSSPDKQAIVDTGIPPMNDNESAIVAALNPGSYTAMVSGVNGGTGVALVEIYDLDRDCAGEEQHYRRGIG